MKFSFRFPALSAMVLFALLFLELSSSGYAQVKNEKTLLWRISGKHSQTSYLFGTMHLTDKRLFNFTDSVYQAIEKSAGFAMEVNPDEAAAFYVTKMFDQLKDGKKLKDVISEKAFSKYEKSLSKKFNKDAEDITTNDLLKEKNKWMSEYIKKGEMPTILDAYLYNIAKRQGKWVGGIEDLIDQTGIVDGLVDQTDLDGIFAGDQGEVNAGLEEMIRLYSNQDIDAIQAFGNEYDRMDLQLIKRNIKMTRRMDSLSSIRTMFFAVGAAHLAGDSGVISLLRKAGYTVSPVVSVKKIQPDSYTYKEVPLQWSSIKDKKGLYEVEMPGQPTSLKLYGIIDMEFLFDISSYSYYNTMAVIGTNEVQNKDSMYRVVANKMFKTKKDIPGTDILVNGIKGKEYVGKIDDANARVWFLVQNRTLFMVMASALKKENLYSKDAEKFLHSFSIKTTTPTDVSPERFTDTAWGISFISPVSISANEDLTKRLSQPSLNIQTHVGVDVKNGSYIFLFSKKPVAGAYFDSDRVTLDEITEGLEKKYGKLSVENKIVQGYNAQSIKAKDTLNKVHMRGLNVARGNQVYSLMVMGDSLQINDSVYNQMFQSISFLPLRKPIWRTETSDKWKFTARIPAPYQLPAMESETDDRAISYDSVSGTSYSFVIDTIKRYTWAASDTAYLEKAVNVYVKTNDSSLKKTILRNNSQLSFEQLFLKDNASTVVRIKAILHGNLLYILYSSGESGILKSAAVDSLYAGFTLNSKPVDFDISASKTALMLKDMESVDSATRANSYEALDKTNVSRKDLPLLHAALFRSFGKMYTYDDDSTAANKEISKVLKAFSEPSTVSYIESNFANLKGHSAHQGLALDLLAGIHTREGYSAMLKLLQSTRLKRKLPYGFRRELTDSLALSASFYPQFAVLIKDTVLGPEIANLTMNLLDSSLLKPGDIKAYEKDFISLSQMLLPGIKELKNYENDYNIEQMVKLLDLYNTEASMKALGSYLPIKDKWLQLEVASILFKKNRPVPVSVLNSLAADKEFRLGLYEKLKSANKQKLFPAAYRTQKHFSESAMLQSASDEDSPSTIKFLSQKTEAIDGKKYRFYLYEIIFEGEEEPASYLGIAGGYDLQGKNPEPIKELTGIYWKEDFDPGKISQQFKSFLASENESTE
jgi:uncharacterized protein YbaP (TraB family)